MAWRLYLSDRPVRRLDILPGKPSVLAAWLPPDMVVYLDLQTGSKRGEQTIEKRDTSKRDSSDWREFVGGLTAPNGVFLPFARVGSNFSMHTIADGAMRLYRSGAVDLSFEINNKDTKLEVDEKAKNFLALDMDRSLGLAAALDQDARLHLYQQNTRIGIFETGLSLQDELRPDLSVAQGGTAIFVTDGRQIIAFNATGGIRRRAEVHYSVGAIRSSPDGHFLVTSDMDASVIRIYNADTLTPLYQRFAVDLLADAKRVQLIPGPATPSGAVGPLAVNNRGVVAFALAGTICATNLARFKPLPGVAPVEEEKEESTKPVEAVATATAAQTTPAPNEANK
jgi:hypothetical protein